MVKLTTENKELKYSEKGGAGTGTLRLDNSCLKSYTYGLISLVIKGCGHLDLPHKIIQYDAGKPLPVPYLQALIDFEKIRVLPRLLRVGSNPGGMNVI
jgi:hypothetical protein